MFTQDNVDCCELSYKTKWITIVIDVILRWCKAL